MGLPRTGLAGGFDRGCLVQELLSLGNSKITAPVAQWIAQKVEENLTSRPNRGITPEEISGLVQIKLEELGLLKKIPAEAPWDPEEITHSLVEPLVPENQMSPPRSNRTQGLLKKNRNIGLPTLEKFLQPLQSHPKETTPRSPPPPRAVLKVTERGLEDILKAYPGLHGLSGARDYLQGVYENIARIAAGMELRFPSQVAVATLEVEFFNAMANQEFYPHHPDLLTGPNLAAYGGHHVWIDLSTGSTSQENFLQEAKKIWEQGGSISFSLGIAPGDVGLTRESFEGLVDAIEKAILDLPENIPIPRTVGLFLPADYPQLEEFTRLVLSGKYYPKFTFHIGLKRGKFLPLGTLPPLNQENFLKEIWKKSEPHFHFLDRLPTPLQGSSSKDKELFRPGGGPPLSPLEICQLGSLNVGILASGGDVDWGKLRRLVRSAVHFLDNLLESTKFPSETIEGHTLANRKIGLGVMGFADLIIKLGIPYDSEDTQHLAKKLMGFIHREAQHSSQALAKYRGAFPNFKNSQEEHQKIPIRHATLTAVVSAPHLARLAGVTPGILPLPSIFEEIGANPVRWEDRQLLPLFKEVCRHRNLWSPRLEAEVMEKSSVRACASASKPLQRLFGVGEEISWTWQQRIQKGFQKYCEGAVVVPLKIPPTEDIQIVKELLQTAEELGLQQICLEQNHLLEAETPAKTKPEVVPDSPPVERPPENSLAAEILGTEEEVTEAGIVPRERPEILQARSHRIQTGYGSMTVTLGFDEKGPYELNAHLGKSGSDEAAQTEGLSRLSTLLLSVGVSPSLIFEQLRGIRCPKIAWDHGREVLSLPDAIAQVLQREFQGLEDEEITVIMAQEQK